MSDDKKAAKTTEEDLVEDEEDEEDLEKLQEEIARMEAEAKALSKQTEDMQKKDGGDAATASSAAAAASGGAEQKQAKDSCSIYVGQVDYSATPEELVSHFSACGTIERVTIVCDKYSGRPKGFAYLEFQEEKSVENAVKLDGSEFKGRQLKVTAKRVNVPHFQRGGRGGRGRGPPGGRFGGRGGRGGRGYRGGYRGGGRGGYYPY